MGDGTTHTLWFDPPIDHQQRRHQLTRERVVDEALAVIANDGAEGLERDSAWLTPDQAAIAAKGAPQGRGSLGLELTRQYYLRIIAARDGSPAARAGLRTGDFIRAIDKTSTRDLSVWAGQHMLRGAPGTKVSLTVLRGSTTEPHVI